MAIVRADPHVLIQASMSDVTEDKRLGILLGGLIRAAGQMSMPGPEKKDAVRRGLKEALFHGVADPDDMRAWLKRINPWEGVAGWTADKAINLVPIEPLVDKLLDVAIESTFQALRRAGVDL